MASVFNSLTAIIGTFLLIIIVVMFCYSAYQNSQFKANAPITCQQVIDKSDYKSVELRDGNYIGYKYVYNGYDICTAKNGTVISNISLGYHEELYFMLYGS